MKSTTAKMKAKVPSKKVAKMKYPKPSKKGFVNWLMQQSPNKKFKAGSNEYCPIGTYAREVCGKIGWADVGVGWSDIYAGVFDTMAKNTSGSRVRDHGRVKLHVALKAAKEVGLIKSK